MKNVGEVLIQFLAVMDTLNRRLSILEQQMDQGDRRTEHMSDQISSLIQQLERENQSMQRFFEGTMSARLKALATAPVATLPEGKVYNTPAAQSHMEEAVAA